jgi:hypothetical protein
MDPPTEFITRESIYTFTGASLAITVLCAAARKLFGYHSPWIPFVLGQLFAFAIAYHDQRLSDLLDVIVTVVNGVILFFAVVGVNETGTAAKTKLLKSPKFDASDSSKPQIGQSPQTNTSGQRVWFKSWFRD